MDLGEDPRLLRQAGDDGTEAAILEADHGQGGILDLDIWMIEIGPATANLVDLTHEPLQQIQLVRRLVHQNASPFRRPFAAPGVGLVVRLVAPAEHREDAQDRLADLAGVDGRLHALYQFIEATLTDDTQASAGLARRGEHGIAVRDRSGQWFL